MIVASGDFDEKQTAIEEGESTYHPSDEQRLLLDQYWKEIQEHSARQGKAIWDEPSARYEGVIIRKDLISLAVSTISFADKKVLRTHPELVTKYPELEPRGLMVQCMIAGSDGIYIFGKKSGKFETTSTMTFIGGVYTIDETIPKPFDMARKEIAEEIGCSADVIESIRLRGIYKNTFGNYGIVFLVKMKKNFEELSVLFDASGERDAELDGIVPVSKSELSEFVLSHIPQAREALELCR